MSDSEINELTHHAMLVAWGEFAHSIGLIQAIERVPLHQKTVTHRPQTKVLEFLVAILAGLEHLKDLSRSAHPIDQDQAVAKAWRQPAWADYSGVSRTLTTLRQEEAEAVAGVLHKITKLILDEEVIKALRLCGRLNYDGDLTGRPVSSSSTTYPNVGYGHMADAIRLGYQAAMVSVHSPTYGRLWLSVAAHPGNTASCTQVEAMVLAAETKTGLRPLRRTDLLRGRLQSISRERQAREAQVQTIETELAAVHAQEEETRQQIDEQQPLVSEFEAAFQAKQRPERPSSTLGRARHKLGVLERRHARLLKQGPKLKAHLARRQGQLALCQAQEAHLQQRLEQFEADNRANRCPIQADFRLDAGFGVRENMALLIEMGYEVYTKPYADWLTPRLKRQAAGRSDWIRVGKNAEMIAWPAITWPDFPYPLDVALQRFRVGDNQKHATLLHFGLDPVTLDLPAWFKRYNARQTIEAGIKEGKGVFEMHHLKVRSAPGLDLQEQFAPLPPTLCAGRPIGWRHNVPSSQRAGKKRRSRR